MLRLLPLLIAGSSAISLAQTPPVTPPVVEQASLPVEAQVSSEAPVELAEPKMKKVCRSIEVVGSAIPRRVCTMKPVRAPAAE